jgi:enterobactin synthetase component D
MDAATSPPCADQQDGRVDPDWESMPGMLQAWWRPLRPLERDASDVCFLAFDSDAFDLRAFRKTAMACPASIERSVRRRQAEFFFGRAAAGRAMSAIGLVPAEVSIGAHREPVWPTGVIGGISHCAGIAAAVVMPRKDRRGVGIDVEQIVDDGLAEELRSTVVNSVEYERLKRHVATGLHLNELLTIAFSAKESLFKAAHASVGDFFGFDAAEFTTLDLAHGRLAFEIRDDLCDALRRGQLCWLSVERLPRGEVFTSWVW